MAGGNPTLYGYVRDVNFRIDQLGWQEKSANWFDIPSEDLNWSNHGNKHVPPPINNKTTWNDVVKSTKNGGPAKYLQGTNIEALERMAWDKGTPVTNGKTWKVMEFDDIIGATEGKPTKYMRVEMSAKTIHGHPISKSEYKKLLKCKS